MRCRRREAGCPVSVGLIFELAIAGHPWFSCQPFQLDRTHTREDLYCGRHRLGVGDKGDLKGGTFGGRLIGVGDRGLPLPFTGDVVDFLTYGPANGLILPCLVLIVRRDVTDQDQA
jgi:hypothetical protein